MEKEIKWSYAHFPVGTVVEVKVFKEPYQVTVKEIVRNGADSYCIITDTPSAIHSGNEIVNINYVTKIIKRGDGPVMLKKERRTIHGQSSHRSQYTHNFSLTLTIGNLLNECCPPDAWVDYEKFEKIVLPFIKFENRDSWCTVVSISKKKLKRLVKQNINRCLMPKKEAIAIDESMYNAEYEISLYEDSLYDGF